MKKPTRPAARKKAKGKRKPIMRHSREGVKLRSRRKADRSKPSVSAGPKQQYIDLFTKEFSTTLKVMKAYPAGQDGFKPHERSYSATRLVHTFAQENFVVTAAIRGELKMPPTDMPAAPSTYAEAVAAYDRGAKALLEVVRAMPESRLFDTVTFFTGPGQMGQVPILDILWLMAMDSIHHRGQLSVYLRMAGGQVPSIYGPSADEPWM